MAYYPDPYAGISQGVTSMGDSLSKAITGYYEDKDQGDFAQRMMDEFMRIPGAVPEDVMAKFPKMSSSQKNNALVAVQWRVARAAQQAKQQREEEDRQYDIQAKRDTHNKMVAEAAKLFQGNQGPQLGQEVPTSRGPGIVTSVPGGGSISLPPAAATPTPRAGQIDLDAQGRPRVDLQRNIYYSGGVPMVLTKEQREQFVASQEDVGRDTKGLEGQINVQKQRIARGEKFQSSRYGSREEKLKALQDQRQSKLGMFGTPAAGAAAGAEASPSPSPAVQAIAPDRVLLVSPPDARGQRKEMTLPHKDLQPFLKANPGWSVSPAYQPQAAAPPRGPGYQYGAPGRYLSPEEQDLLAV